MQVNNPLQSFTRPANTTAYAVGALVANSTTAAAVVPMTFQLGNMFGQGQLRLTRARLFKSGSTIANASFRIHVYEALPVVSNGDGGAWLSTMAAHWIGNIDVTSMLAFSDGAAGTGSCPAGSEIFLKTAAGSQLFCLLMALGAYTPASAEQFSVVLEELDAY
jgi:hypothetical protein